MSLLTLVVLLLSGCVALGGAATAYGVVGSLIGIVQRNQSQDVAEAQVRELQGLRGDLRAAGLVPTPPLPISEVARERELAAREPEPRPHSFWSRMLRVIP